LRPLQDVSPRACQRGVRGGLAQIESQIADDPFKGMRREQSPRADGLFGQSHAIQANALNRRTRHVDIGDERLDIPRTPDERGSVHQRSRTAQPERAALHCDRHLADAGTLVRVAGPVEVAQIGARRIEQCRRPAKLNGGEADRAPGKSGRLIIVSGFADQRVAAQFDASKGDTIARGGAHPEWMPRRGVNQRRHVLHRYEAHLPAAIGQCAVDNRALQMSRAGREGFRTVHAIRFLRRRHNSHSISRLGIPDTEERAAIADIGSGSGELRCAPELVQQMQSVDMPLVQTPDREVAATEVHEYVEEGQGRTRGDPDVHPAEGARQGSGEETGIRDSAELVVRECVIAVNDRRMRGTLLGDFDRAINKNTSIPVGGI